MAAVTTRARYVYESSARSAEIRNLLGKGANIAEMTRVRGPVRIPKGSTITTHACVAYMRLGGRFPKDSSYGGAGCSPASRSAW